MLNALMALAHSFLFFLSNVMLSLPVLLEVSAGILLSPGSRFFIILIIEVTRYCLPARRLFPQGKR
jgi:hypothetical protein